MMNVFMFSVSTDTHRYILIPHRYILIPHKYIRGIQQGVSEVVTVNNLAKLTYAKFYIISTTILKSKPNVECTRQQMHFY